MMPLPTNYRILRWCIILRRKKIKGLERNKQNTHYSQIK